MVKPSSTLDTGPIKVLLAILALTKGEGDKETTVREVARSLEEELDYTTVTLIVADLEVKGLVKGRREGRFKVIASSPEGTAAGLDVVKRFRIVEAAKLACVGCACPNHEALRSE